MIQFALKLFIKLIIHFSPKELCASSICQYMGNDATIPGASFISTVASVVRMEPLTLRVLFLAFTKSCTSHAFVRHFEQFISVTLLLMQS